MLVMQNGRSHIWLVFSQELMATPISMVNKAY